MIEFCEDIPGLRVQVFERAVVVNNKIDKRDFFAVQDLSCDTAMCVRFDLDARGRPGELRKAINVTRDAELSGGGNEDDFVETMPPAGYSALLIGFENKSRFNDGDCMGIFRENIVGPLLLCFDDRRMHDAIQLEQAVLAKSEIGEE
jgi:hypothetical protein